MQRASSETEGKNLCCIALWSKYANCTSSLNSLTSGLFIYGPLWESMNKQSFSFKFPRRARLTIAIAGQIDAPSQSQLCDDFAKWLDMISLKFHQGLPNFLQVPVIELKSLFQSQSQSLTGSLRMTSKLNVLKLMYILGLELELELNENDWDLKAIVST